jgi:hypothetical protein
MYSLTEFSIVVILYTAGTTLSDNQYVFLDFMVCLPTCLFMGWIVPADKLSVIRPAGSLLILPVILSVLGFIILQFAG